MVVVIAIAIAGAGTLTALLVSRLTGQRDAGPIFLLAMTPLVPRVNLGFGFGLDDVIPLAGVAMLLFAGLPRWPRLARGWGRLGTAFIIVGVALYVSAGIISGFANGDGPFGFIRMALRSSGRMLFLLLLAALVADRVHRRWDMALFAARSLALFGTLEAAFGLFAFLVPLPGNIGLEVVKRSSVLAGEVPGRIAGTLGLSPNFTGAVLLLAFLVTVGLAVRPSGRRERSVLLLTGVLQLAALILTFSRAPLAAAVVGVLGLLVVTSRPILLLPIAGVLGMIGTLTPVAGRFLSDATDRLALWYAAALMMLDHPLAGVGPGRMLQTIRADPDRYLHTPYGTATNNAHNTILLPAAELGVLGGLGAALVNVGVAAVAILAIVRFRKVRSEAHVVAGGVAMLAFLGQGMVNNLFTVGVTSVMGAFVFGAFVFPAVLAFDQGSREEE